MLTTLALLVLLVPAAEPSVEADYLIQGATIHDGSGKAAQKGDLAIKGDRIVAVGSFKASGKPRIIDGRNLVVTPGYIDLHTHSDSQITQAATRANLNYLTQGVTTIVTGNCGAGPVDVAGYYQKLDKAPPGSNVIHQMPHNDLRRKVMGNANRPPTRKELEQMKGLMDKGMREGAWGLSTGLYYTPGSYARLGELVELARVAADHGGFYASHMRDEGPGLLASVTETLEIGQKAGLPVHISHFKAYSPRGWGKAADAIALIDQARGRGQVVTADQYPYTASSTSLAADVIPSVYREGTQKDLLARLDDPEQGNKIREAMTRLIKDLDNGKRIRIAFCAKKPQWQGKDLAAIAEQEKKSPVDIAVEIERLGGAQIVNFSMQEEEVRLIMKQPFVATASDGSSRVPDDSMPHPRSYGCFARKIGYYAISEKAIPVELAVRSASGLPADILRLSDRGYIKSGFFADVVVLDPKTFRDAATFEKPHQYAPGVKYLFVNGVLTIDKEKFTGQLGGKALRHKSGRP